MPIEIVEESSSSLAQYAQVPIAFEVRHRFVVSAPDGGLGGLPLMLEDVEEPYVKDYDAEPDNHPTAWAQRFDTASWRVLAARHDGTRVGGAVIARSTPALDLLEGPADLALLWDLRVAPSARGRGIGAALFDAASGLAQAGGASWLKVETQNVNVAACRFYARHGCTLGAVHRFAYPRLPDEVQLLWYKRLTLSPDVARPRIR